MIQDPEFDVPPALRPLEGLVVGLGHLVMYALGSTVDLLRQTPQPPIEPPEETVRAVRSDHYSSYYVRGVVDAIDIGIPPLGVELRKNPDRRENEIPVEVNRRLRDSDRRQPPGPPGFESN